MTFTPPPDPLIGTVLADRYRICASLGRGGCGQVYLAEHVTIERTLAVKVMTGEQPGLSDENGRRRFLQEARATSKIDHPHVIDIIDFGYTPDGLAYYVMEFLSGEDLAGMLRREGPLPWSRLGPMILQIASALAAAHRHGIVHRDIKPANCFRITVEDDPDFIKVLDFGIAKVHAPPVPGGAEMPQTASHVLLGTPAYMAPELASGGVATVRSDIYALGVLIYELATGKKPFSGASFLETLFNHAYKAAVVPSDLVPELAGEVERIILRAIAKDPAERYAEMRELHADVKLSLARPAAPVAAPPPVVRPPHTDELAHAVTEAHALAGPPSTPAENPAGQPSTPAENSAEPPAPTPIADATPAPEPPPSATEPTAHDAAAEPPDRFETVTVARPRGRPRRAALLVAVVGSIAAVVLAVQFARRPAEPAKTDVTASPIATAAPPAPKPIEPAPTPPAPTPQAQPSQPSQPGPTKQPEPTKPPEPKKQPEPAKQPPAKDKPRPPSDPPKPAEKTKPTFAASRASARMAAALATAETTCFERHRPPAGFEFDVAVSVAPSGAAKVKGSASSAIRKCLLDAVPANLDLGATVDGGGFEYTFRQR